MLAQRREADTMGIGPVTLHFSSALTEVGKHKSCITTPWQKPKLHPQPPKRKITEGNGKEKQAGTPAL